jgi:nifR3 family TIM-barrel protein
MSRGFWDRLNKPIMALAPMADVTDAAYRRVIAKYGGPDVMWTEFVSADGLALAPEAGRKKLLADLIYTESERPIVAQFFTSRPENMEKAASLARELGFDGVDINMGCPDKSIEKQGAGAAHIKDPKRAQEVIAAAKRGAGSLPVSVKTRLGYNKDELETWLPTLLETGLAAITIHARTRKEMSLVPARWERVARAVAIRDEMKSDTLILGNGDAGDLEHARALASETGADGVMLGRAIFGNPWLFCDSLRQVSVSQRLKALVEHTKLYEELLPHKSFAIMKKHFKAYIKDFEARPTERQSFGRGAAELRGRLMEARDAASVESIAKDFCASL